MKKITIAENFLQYQFPPRTEKQHFGFNIYGLVNGKEAVVGSSCRLSYAEATKECTCKFLHAEWHETL